VSEYSVRGKLRGKLIDIGSQAYKESFSNSIKPFPDVKPTLTALMGDGYKLGIISTGEKNFQLYKLRKTRLLDYFYREKYFGQDLVFISSDFGDGADKPSPVMYQEAVRRSGARPREIMFVGDRLSDVVGANLVGMRSVIIVRDKASGKGHSARLGLEKPDHLIGKASDVMKILK
jgi:HAD superfamily hydrolase (TIGR01549 family)